MLSAEKYWKFTLKNFQNKNDILIIQSKRPVCGSEKPRFMKEQESKGLLSNLGIETPLSKVPLLGDILFCVYKMNEIVNNFLLAGDKFMPQMHLRQLGFTYSAFGPFIKNKDRIEKFIQTGNKNFVYKNDLDKACFQHDIAYGKYKDLTERIQSDKFLRDEAFEIANNSKHNAYWRGLGSMVYRFFDKKTTGSGVATLANKSMPNYQTANELHKPIIRKFKRRDYSSLRCSIWGVDLAYIQ